MRWFFMYGGFAWLALAAIFLVVEALTTGLVSIWFAGGALAAFLFACFGAPVWLQILVFIVVSVILLVVTRPLANKYFNKRRTVTNAQSVVGKTALVKEEIDNLTAGGLVTVDGVDWTARTETDGERIGAGEAVEVLRIEGVKLIVRRAVQTDGPEVQP